MVLNGRCYVCRGKDPRICFPQNQRLLQKWLLVLKCQPPSSVGNLGPRLCTKHFREEDFEYTKVGIRLKKNVVPMIGVQREQDFRDDIEVVSSDGVSFQFNKAHLVALCPALVTIIGSCKEETSKLVLDFNTETLESFYDLLHLGEGCINGNDHLLDLKQLLLNLGVQEDQLSASVIDDFQSFNNEFISRHQPEPELESRNDSQRNNDPVPISRDPPFLRCPVEGCTVRFKNKTNFWQHVSYKHFKSELMENIPKREGKYFNCPLCDHKTESPDSRLILFHYSISHKIVNEMFSKKFPDHILSSSSSADKS